MSDYYPSDMTAIPALCLRALAENRAGAPYTAGEIAELISDDYPAVDEVPEQATSRRLATLYQKHAVDRRKREQENGKPYEYWLAGRGRFIAQSEGWLPEPEGPEDLRENPGPDALMETVGASEESEEQVVEDVEGLNAALRGIANTLKDHEETLEQLKGDSVMAEELEQVREEVDDALQNSVKREVLDDLETLQEQVNALGQAVQREQEGETDEFARAIRSLRRLEREGYYVHEIVRSEEYGGKVAEVRVKAKKGDEKDRRIAEADTDAEGGPDGPE
jgi:vacuolar-type H+-ATPase subunit I/STV1